MFVNKCLIIVFACLVSSAKCIDVLPYGWQDLFKLYFETNLQNVVKDFDADVEDSACKTELIYVYQSILENERWAYKMLDAWAKPQAGLLVGNGMHIGNYDECLGVKAYINETHIKGKYCSVFIEPDRDVASLFLEFIRGYPDNKTHGELITLVDVLKTSWGICIPATCTQDNLQDVWNFTQNYFKLKFKINFVEHFCDYNGKHSLSPLSIFTIILFATICFVVIVCTVYDITIYQQRKTKPQSPTVITAFSAYTNGKKIFSTATGDSLTCLNGLRVISMLWIILAHRYTFVYYVPHINGDVLEQWKLRTENMIFVAAVLGVDTFFTISGFLVAYLFFQSRHKGMKINLPMFYIHRYIRLTPSLAVVVLLFTSLYCHLGSGPFWPFTLDLFQKACEKHWWATLLYVQNYVYPNSHCITHAWYLAVDMQLYVLSPLLLFPMSKWPKSTIVVIVGLVLATMVSVFTQTWIKKLGSTYFDENEEYHRKYIYTHNRASPWLIGFIMGYIMFKIKNRSVYIKKYIAVILWGLSLTVLASLVFGHVSFTRNEYNVVKSSIFNAFMQPSWAIALCWIIFACGKGYGGFINDFLSLPIFNVLIKINYAMYLIQFIPIVYIICRGRTSTFLSNFNEMYWVWSDFVATVVLAVVWTLLFESPIITLERIIFKGDRKQISVARNGPSATHPVTEINTNDNMKQVI